MFECIEIVVTVPVLSGLCFVLNLQVASGSMATMRSSVKYNDTTRAAYALQPPENCL